MCLVQSRVVEGGRVREREREREESGGPKFVPSTKSVGRRWEGERERERERGVRGLKVCA